MKILVADGKGNFFETETKADPPRVPMPPRQKGCLDDDEGTCYVVCAHPSTLGG